MTERVQQMMANLEERFGARLQSCTEDRRQVVIEVLPEHQLEVCRALRDEDEFGFDQLIDLCGVDYSSYGQSEWATDDASSTGFSRGVLERSTGRLPPVAEESVAEQNTGRRFAVVMHLLSVRNNQRIRVRIFAAADAFPVVSSLTGIWNSANWFEREAFDLFGIMFEGHPDLRRLLTDYGFIGHPFRKDFPLVGNVEVRYDAEKQRVVYQPVTIEPRVLVPRVIRAEAQDEPAGAERQPARK